MLLWGCGLRGTVSLRQLVPFDRSPPGEGGLGPGKKVLNHLLIHNPASPYLKSVLGARLHLKLFMVLRLGYWPQIEDPRTFNEKVAYRKLFADEDLFTTVEDKWGVRSYVAEKVGEDVLPEAYHVTTDPEDVPFDDLPETYVIKPTHMAGPIIFVEADDVVDPDEVRTRCRDWLSTTHNVMKEESWYWDITPRIVAEEYLTEEDGSVPPDFKFFVFHGQVEYVQVDLDRFSDHKRRFYDRDWNPKEFKRGYPLAPETSRPETYDRMLEVAEALGDDFDFIRVDLYEVDGEEVYFGEMTVGPASGVGRFVPQEYDFRLGELW